jgi:hypothetical protein
VLQAWPRPTWKRDAILRRVVALTNHTLIGGQHHSPAPDCQAERPRVPVSLQPHTNTSTATSNETFTRSRSPLSKIRDCIFMLSSWLLIWLRVRYAHYSSSIAPSFSGLFDSSHCPTTIVVAIARPALAERRSHPLVTSSFIGPIWSSIDSTSLKLYGIKETTRTPDAPR